mmetsp:Transcript_24408/g.36218  ORF Transcript_24408/g.36218 Transcript_24408/m.36218 type:complete len:287 (-) Transcript_24408:181-1041(-)
MVWNRIFPGSGGGYARRWLRITEAKFRKRRIDRSLKGPITLFDFSNPDDAADASRTEKDGGWKLSDDQVIGGYSEAALTVIPSHEQQMELDQKRSNPRSGTQKFTYTDSNESFRPFIRWQGQLDTRIGASSTAHRSGFCAIKSPTFGTAASFNAFGYNAIEVTCRSSSKRDFTINVEISTMLPGLELYQNVLSVPEEWTENKRRTIRIAQDGFVTVISPLKDFESISRNRLRDLHTNISLGADLDSFGIILKDGVTGDFTFDLAKVRLMNFYHGEILGEEDEDAPY